MPSKEARREVMRQYGMSEEELEAMEMDEGPTPVETDLWEVLGVEKGTTPQQLKKVRRQQRLETCVRSIVD